MEDTERVTRGNLPHWYKPGHAHFVTYRLAGSIPQFELQRWRAERDRRLKQKLRDAATFGALRERAHKAFFGRYDHYLDRNADVRWLEEPDVANVVRENLYHHHGSLYELIAWCLMPNHVHVVLQPFEAATDAAVADAASIGLESAFHSDEVSDSSSVLSRIMHSLKSYTANRANEILKRTGRFWQSESYDHWVRDLDELERIVEYVRLNPVHAGLCLEPHLWPFSSAHDRFRRDGSRCALVGWLRGDWKTAKFGASGPASAKH